MADSPAAVRTADGARGEGDGGAGAPGARSVRPARARLERRWDLLAHALRCYWLIAAMWVRSTLAYRVSFVMTLIGDFTATAFDFAAILLMFSQVDSLGGYPLPEVAVLYGAAGTSFGLADMAMGSTERLGRRVRDGTLDVLLVRPVPVLAQIAADRFALRRLGRITQGALVLGYGLAAAPIAWTPQKVLLVPVMLVSGAAVFSAVFVAGAAFQFAAQDAAEVQNSLTYGGTTLLEYPPTVFAKELVRGVTFVVPLAFVNWLPALYLLGRPYPIHLPQWLAWAPPLVALACCTLAGAAWRVALRSYRSTGS